MTTQFGYIDQLISYCNQARSTEPIRVVPLSGSSQLFDISLTKIGSIKTAIYVIEEIGGSNETTFESFKSFKNKKEHRCPKLNCPSNILYVGSSTTSLTTRLKQHLGNGNKNTYALNLKHWFKGEFKITIKEYDVKIEILQIIEDALAFELKPAFGKMGGNGR